MKKIFSALALLALLGCTSSCGTLPQRDLLVQLAREGGRYEVTDVSYDDAKKQAMVGVRNAADKSTTDTVYRWYSFEGDQWRAMPMVGVQRPANMSAPVKKPTGTNSAPVIHFEPAAK